MIQTHDHETPMQETVINPPEGEADVDGFKDIIARIIARVALEHVAEAQNERRTVKAA